jgi:hypothetical protein
MDTPKLVKYRCGSHVHEVFHYYTIRNDTCIIYAATLRMNRFIPIYIREGRFGKKTRHSVNFYVQIVSHVRVSLMLALNVLSLVNLRKNPSSLSYEGKGSGVQVAVEFARDTTGKKDE